MQLESQASSWIGQEAACRRPGSSCVQCNGWSIRNCRLPMTSLSSRRGLPSKYFSFPKRGAKPAELVHCSHCRSDSQVWPAKAMPSARKRRKWRTAPGISSQSPARSGDFWRVCCSKLLQVVASISTEVPKLRLIWYNKHAKTRLQPFQTWKLPSWPYGCEDGRLSSRDCWAVHTGGQFEKMQVVSVKILKKNQPAHCSLGRAEHIRQLPVFW